MGKQVRLAFALVIATVGVAGCPSTPEPVGTDGGPIVRTDGGPPCATATDCDDGRFCNGPETCDATSADADERGCAPGALPCLESQRCSETEGRCISACAIAADADGDGADAMSCGGTDCDDADARRTPGGIEICDAENRDEDCDPATFGSRDADGDTFVDAACCNGTGTTMRCGNDCNDSRRDSHPGATEACERIDNDCDGATDEGLTVMAWPDRDFDLHGIEDDSMRQEVCPGTPGYSQVSDDCDDASPLRHRAQLEICDLIDNNCNGTVDESPVSIAWYPDGDGDLFGAPDPSMASGGVVISCAPVDGHSSRSSDCDDSDAQVHPGARELCNGVDDDCNGYADGGALTAGDTEDDDGDQFPDAVCGGNDCDDANVSVNPDAQELCNGIDDDCDAIVDGASADAVWFLDRDRDGYGDTSGPGIMACESQPGRVPRGGDCDDADASVHPRVPDFCDDIDADCDGSIDENGVRFAFFPDADADGWGDTDLMGVVFRCASPSGMGPAGTSARTGDCDDTVATRYPGAAEQCDGLDHDCDSRVDENSDQMWFPDGDGDGHGAGTPIIACLRPPGHALLADDCDDVNGANFPGNTETCNALDEDCNGIADNGAGAYCDAFPRTGPGTACSGGVCVLTCDAGYANCDGVLSDGCEVFTQRSAVYCGSCTNACTPGDTCGIGMPGTCDVSPVIAIGGGADASLALRATGGVAAWGDAGGAAQTTSGTDAPVPFATTLSGIVGIDIGGGHGCALTAGARVLCWGGNGSGQLGDGSLASRATPLVVATLPDAAQISTGGSHTCAVLTDGTLMCWGANSSGQLGDGTTTLRRLPTLVIGVTDAVEVQAGLNYTCARRGTTDAYYVSCWGVNANGQLGIGTVDVAIHPSPLAVIGLPGNVSGLADTIPGVSNYAITTDGFAYGWGRNFGNDLGLGGPTGELGTPTRNTLLSGVVEVSMGAGGGCARARGVTAGTVDIWCWGGQSFAWIDGTTTGVRPTPILAGPTGARITDAVAISAGAERWCALRPDGSVWCMGSDASGGLGNDVPIANRLAPVPVLNLP